MVTRKIITMSKTICSSNNRSRSTNFQPSRGSRRELLQRIEVTGKRTPAFLAILNRINRRKVFTGRRSLLLHFLLQDRPKRQLLTGLPRRSKSSRSRQPVTQTGTTYQQLLPEWQPPREERWEVPQATSFPNNIKLRKMRHQNLLCVANIVNRAWAKTGICMA